jgi:PmbA protein
MNEITQDSLMDLATKVKDYSMSKGVDEAEVYFSYLRKIEILAENQSISTERDKSELGFSVRVLKNYSEGFSYSNKLDLGALKNCADEAIGIANVAPPKEDATLPEPKKYPKVNGIYSSKIENLTVDDLIDNMKVILGIIKDSEIPVRVNLSPLTLIDDWRGIVNSRGIEAFEKSNNYNGVLLAVARDGEKIGSFIIADFFTRDPSTVDYQTFTEDLVTRAIRNINPITPKFIDSDVVVFKKGALNPILQVIDFAVNSSNVQQHRSMWKDQLLSEVAINDFNLIDDSHNSERGAGVRSFDDEGNPTQKTHIIKNGLLERFLFDQLRGNRANTNSTGNSKRLGTRFMNPPGSILPNGPKIEPGDMEFEELIGDIKEGIIFDRFSGSVQPPNGIFSGVVKGAQLIKNGELAEPLTNVTVGGNVFDVLKNIEGIGKDLELIGGFITAPLIKAKGVPIKTQ